MLNRNVIVIAGAMLFASCGTQPANESADAVAAGANNGQPYVRAHSIQELMANIVEVQAQVFWGSSGWVVDETGEHDLTPTTDERWLATRSAAATVAEMGNLLMTPLYAQDRGKDWIQFSQALVQVGMRAEKAAVDRNTDAIFETGGTMYRVCQACHQVYIKGNLPPVQEPKAAG
jgi:hypothetical protein